ncbi:MAG: hypothetical protein JWM60_1651 [Solirubrobacterales bacterium]|nr:hypothetical protein [Solirubrobacterales bacterium]
MGTETITVYLLKDTVTAATDALRVEPNEYREHAVRAGRTTATLYVAQVDDREPPWVRLLAPVTEPPVAERTRTSSAVLLLRTSRRWFAIAFGQGRHLLDPAAYVRRFGLRVALNAADPAQLRGAQARSFNEYALHTQRQVSRLSGVEALELDIERDLVTSLAGAVGDPALGKRIEGRDAVRLTAELSVSALGRICTALLREYKKTGYRTHYPWIDNVEEIVDPTKVSTLDEAAATRLGERRFPDFDLFPPELVTGEIVQFRTYPPLGGLVLVEPDSSLLRHAIPRAMSGAEANEKLRYFKVIGVDDNGDEIDRWSLWECLHHERRSGSETLVLDNGQWYRVQRNFAKGVDDFARELSSSGLDLPAARRTENEGQYNARAANDRALALLDQRLIRLPGLSAIEPCDLFSPRGHFIHVKRRKGGSAPLSHLFAQASVSGEALLEEPAFRVALRGKLSETDATLAALITEPPKSASLPVVLGLITKASTPSKRPAAALPFFSKIALRQTVKRLRAMNFEVFVDEIPTEPPG